MLHRRSYELFLNMCDLIYLMLTRGTPHPDDLHAVTHLLLVTTSSRFLKLYTEDPMFTAPQVGVMFLLE